MIIIIKIRNGNNEKYNNIKQFNFEFNEQQGQSCKDKIGTNKD